MLIVTFMVYGSANMLFICYPKCTTCQKAKKFLIENNISFIERDIKEHNPSKEEIIEFHNKSGVDLKKIFNTSGLLYKELHLNERLNQMTNDEIYDLLASNGMLVKRPIFVFDDFVIFGFKEDKLIEALKK